MPTILTKDGFRLFFYSADGAEPTHVHVEYAEAHAKYWLRPLSLASSYRMRAKDLRRARRLIEANALLIEERWHDYFDSSK